MLNDPRFSSQKQRYEDLLREVKAIGCDTDELPEATGEFGLSPTNPIPTQTILGSYLYLAQLRTTDGQRVTNRRRGSMVSPLSPKPIDVYDMFSADGAPLAAIYISPYHKRNSAKVPKGFVLALSS